MDVHHSDVSIQNHLDAGITAARAGAKAQARTHFLEVLRAAPHHETAWLWLSALQPTTERALQCVERVLTINPQHVQAKQAQEVLRVRLLIEEAAILPPTGQEAAPIAPEPPPSTAQRRCLLGEALVEAGVLTAWQVEQAVRHQAELAQPQPVTGLRKLLSRAKRRPAPTQRLGEILMELGMVTRDQLAAALARQVEQTGATDTETGFGRFGDYLVRQALITAAQLHYALVMQAQRRRDGTTLQLGEVLVQLGYLEQEQVTQAVLEWHQEYELAFD